jgi:hypothetical protein
MARRRPKVSTNLLNFEPGEPTGGVGLEPGIGEATPDLGGMDTSTLSDADLAQLAGTDAGSVDPVEMEVEQLQAQLADPNLDPATRDQIQQMLALAARRRMAGMGAGAGGGLPI